MNAPAECRLIGRWRIIEADIWDRAYLNLSGPATITITDHGHGEIAFGALQAGLDIEYSRSSIGFTWQGFDEMDEVAGDGSAELLDDGTIKIEFAYHNGDEAVLKAKRNTSSTAC
jgi:hypothetical protein